MAAGLQNCANLQENATQQSLSGTSPETLNPAEQSPEIDPENPLAPGVTSIIESYGVDTPKSIAIKLKEPLEIASVTDLAGYRSSAGFPSSVEYTEANPLLIRIHFNTLIFPKKTELTARNWVIKSSQKTIRDLVFYFQAQTKIAFVTESSGPGNFSMWSLAGGKSSLEAATAICNAEAAAGGWEGEFAPLIASQGRSALDTFITFKGGWMTTKGEPFVINIDEFKNGYYLSAPRYTAKGVRADASGNAYFWSGANATGQPDLQAGDFCSNWNGTGTTMVGSANASGAAFLAPQVSADCSTPARLICLQKGDGVNFTLPLPANPKRVFVTSKTGTGNLASWTDAGGNSGLAAGHAVCQKLAADAMLPNAQNFRAFLSTTTTNSREFFSTTNLTPYYNTRNALVGDSVSAILSGNSLSSTIAYDETGKTITDGVLTAFTGSDALGLANFEPQCDNWTSSDPAKLGTYGSVGAGTARWIKDVRGTCSTLRRLICVGL